MHEWHYRTVEIQKTLFESSRKPAPPATRFLVHDSSPGVARTRFRKKMRLEFPPNTPQGESFTHLADLVHEMHRPEAACRPAALPSRDSGNVRASPSFDGVDSPFGVLNGSKSTLKCRFRRQQGFRCRNERSAWQIASHICPVLSGKGGRPGTRNIARIGSKKAVIGAVGTTHFLIRRANRTCASTAREGRPTNAVDLFQFRGPVSFSPSAPAL
jgi:hypothetical protein